ncbi:MAG: hypothetical protein J2P34_09810 [Actinobacteria bacterium]|nr:hypothetical protein [Actinomycetota bacterium]
MRTAALLMYAGAAISLVNAVVVATTIASYRAAIHRSFPRYSPAQVHAVASAGVVFTVVLAIVEIFFWLWLAWACRAGRNWGRITGTVLFGLNTLLLLVPLLGRANAGVVPRATVGTLLTVLVWLAGLGAVIMLWLPASSAYFTGAWRE